MFETIQSFGEEVGTIAYSGDVRHADSLQPNQISDEVPSDIYVFGPIVKDRVIGEGDSTSIIRKNVDWFVREHMQFLAQLSYPYCFLTRNP